MKLRARKKRF